MSRQDIQTTNGMIPPWEKMPPKLKMEFLKTELGFIEEIMKESNNEEQKMRLKYERIKLQEAIRSISGVEENDMF